MGTNYYTLDGIHIGKKSYAGIWCTECRIEADVIFENDERVSGRDRELASRCFHNEGKDVIDYACSMCGRKQSTSPEIFLGVGRFTWAINTKLGDCANEVKESLKRRKYVRTGGGEKLEIYEFLSMLVDVLPERASHYEFS